ncbi:MAG: RNA polymerase sigma factor [Bacteroidota bacterium]
MTYEQRIIALKNYIIFGIRKYYKTVEKQEDAFQDVYYILLQNKKKYENATNTQLQNLAYTIIKNNFIDSYRMEKRRVAVNYDINKCMSAKEKISADSFALIEDIKKGVKKLKARQKRIIELRIKGYSYKEISEIMDVSMGTVKSDIYRVRNIHLSYLC